MNLSNIKKVAFIENFNPKMGYPQFAYKSTVVAKPGSTSVNTSKKVNVLTDDQLAAKLAIKEAKKASKWLNGSRPTLLVSTKLN